MRIDSITCGLIKNNNYFIIEGDECLIIDISDFSAVDKFIQENHLKVKGVLLTHSHWDHLMGVEEFVKKYNAKVYLGSRKPNYITKKEFDYTKEKYGVTVEFDADVIYLEEGENTVDQFNFYVIETPGHTYCSVVYYFKQEGIMFTGDFLFKGTIGITTSMYSNKELMEESLRKILNYPDEIVIYPGHGAVSILGEEKRSNMFLKRAR